MPLFQRITSNTSLFRVFLATSYVKLQQAYVSEAVAVGNWTIIGYKGPGEQTSGKLESKTTNFTYQDGYASYSNNTVALSSTKIKGFTVQNNTKLNDCTSAADNWKVEVSKATGSEGEAVFEATTNCTDLTPNFAKIGD